MAVGALIVAGCSGGDDDGAAETTTTAVEASTTAPTSTTTAAPTTEAPTTEAPTSTAAPSTTRPATTEPPSTEPPSTEPPTTTGPATTAPVTTEPPSTSEPGPALDPSEAEAKIRSVGEWDPDMTTYDPAATLTAVTAVRIGSGSGGAPMQVFFFNSGRYLGPATGEPRIAPRHLRHRARGDHGQLQPLRTRRRLLLPQQRPLPGDVPLGRLRGRPRGTTAPGGPGPLTNGTVSDR